MLLTSKTHSRIRVLPSLLAAAAIVLLVNPERAAAQAGTKSGKPTQGKAAAPAPPGRTTTGGAPAKPAADSAERDAILKSQPWQQTIADFNTWLTGQSIYDAQQVQQTKARLDVGISRMTASQLRYFQSDLQAKLQVLTSEQSRDAEAYLAQTLSVASPAYARKVRQKLPDLLTATAGQVSQQLAAFAAKRDNTAAMQQAFNDSRQQQIAYNEAQVQARAQESERALDRAQASAASAGSKGNNFTPARDYFPNAGNDGPFGPGTSIGFWGGGFF